MGKIYVGDIGTEFLLDAGQAITGATVSIAVLKPGATAEVPWSASVHTIDGAARYVRHTTVDGDLDVAGSYRLQPVIALADGTWAGRGETEQVQIFDHQE